MSSSYMSRIYADLKARGVGYHGGPRKRARAKRYHTSKSRGPRLEWRDGRSRG